ncbi:hypothetical protein [Paludisphaera mucosa]|uniref:Uncharacterized protein n=1 Tax=Paludisphaera mucosa TaxID=3030827 RepID=A0ABT6F6R4_9BACT|nr:hypothetical protein [Paludisphaera mucosa]MDG3003286.1 hypothetical protein [Paludisphaera mucosa]
MAHIAAESDVGGVPDAEVAERELRALLAEHAGAEAWKVEIEEAPPRPGDPPGMLRFKLRGPAEALFRFRDSRAAEGGAGKP